MRGAGDPVWTLTTLRAINQLTREALEARLSLDILERAWAATLSSTRGTGPPVLTPRPATGKRMGMRRYLLLAAEQRLSLAAAEDDLHTI